MWSSLAIVVRESYTTCGCGGRAGIGIASLTFTTPQKMDILQCEAGLSARGLVGWVELFAKPIVGFARGKAQMGFAFA